MLGKQSAGGCKQRLWEQLGLAIVGCLFAAGAFLSWRKWPDAQIDYGLQLYLPWQISQGAVLYSGVKYLVGGPLSQYFNACLFRVFGVSLLTLVTANLVLAALWLALLYRRFLAASDAWTATLICGGVVLVFAFSQDADVGNYNYVTPYCHEVWHGLVLSTLAIVFWSRWLERGRWWSAAAAGFCSGLVFMTKPEVFAALMAASACAPAVFWMIQRRGTSAGRFAGAATKTPAPALIDPDSSRNFVLKSAGAFVLAALVPVLVFFFYFLRIESWWESLRSVCFAWVPLLGSSAAHNAFYAWCMGLDAPAHNLGAMISQFAIIVAGIGACGFVFRGKPHAPAKRLSWLILGALLLGLASRYNWSDCGRSLPLLSLVACAILARILLSRPRGITNPDREATCPESPTQERPLWFPLLWSVFGLFLLGKLGLFSRIWHYGFVLAMPAFAGAVYLFFWLVPLLAEKYSVNRQYFRACIGLVLAVGFLRLFTQTQFIYHQKTLAVGEGRDRIVVFPEKLNQADPIIQSAVAWFESNTPSNATLAVLPEGAMVNYLSRRRNPTGYLLWDPTVVKFFGPDNMVSAFQRNSPDYVIFLPREVSEFGVKPFGQGKGFGLELVQWLHEHYEPVASLNGTPGAKGETGLVFKRISAGR
jgi:hypothetical protein